MITEHDWSAATARELAVSFGARAFSSCDPAGDGAVFTWGEDGKTRRCYSWGSNGAAPDAVRGLGAFMPDVLVIEAQFAGNRAGAAATAIKIGRHAGFLVGAYALMLGKPLDVVWTAPAVWQSWLRSQVGKLKGSDEIKKASASVAGLNVPVQMANRSKARAQGIADAYCIGAAWHERVRGLV